MLRLKPQLRTKTLIKASFVGNVYGNKRKIVSSSWNAFRAFILEDKANKVIRVSRRPFGMKERRGAERHHVYD
jgi:hypothetical protein